MARNLIKVGVCGSLGGHLGPKSRQGPDFIDFWLDFGVHFGGKSH